MIILRIIICFVVKSEKGGQMLWLSSELLKIVSGLKIN